MRMEGVTFIVTLLHPKSVGDIKLSSNDPMASPIIDPHYFEHAHDVRAMSEVTHVSIKQVSLFWSLLSMANICHLTEDAMFKS